jgi:hypothetical protein
VGEAGILREICKVGVPESSPTLPSPASGGGGVAMVSAAASALGFHGIHFTMPDALHRALVGIGLA